MGDHVEEGLAERAGPSLLGQELVALRLEPALLGDVGPGADHPDRRPAASRKTRPTPWVQWTDPSGQSRRNSRLKRCAVRERLVDGLPEPVSIVGVDGLEVARRRSACRPVGSKPCWSKIASDQTSRPVLHVPLPEAGPRSREDELEPLVTSFDVSRHRADLGERCREAVTRGPDRGDEERHDGADQHVEDDPCDVDPRHRERRAVGSDEDDSVEHARDERGREPAAHPADPGRQRGRRDQDDEATLAAEQCIEPSLGRDRRETDADPDGHRGRRPDPDATQPREVLPCAAQGRPSRPADRATVSGCRRHVRSIDVMVLPLPVAVMRLTRHRREPLVWARASDHTVGRPCGPCPPARLSSVEVLQP